MKMLLFDIDGTLLKTKGAGRLALERVFEEMFGVASAWGDLKPDGRTDPWIIDELAKQHLGRSLNKREYQAVVLSYHRYFKKKIKEVEFHLMPGIKALIEKLYKRSDLLLGLATGNFEEASYYKLKRGSLDRYFKFGGFGSDSYDRTELTHIAIKRGRKHLRDKKKIEQILLIGDTIHDIRVGKELGLCTIAVSTGTTSISDLKKYSPDHVFKDFSEHGKFLKLLH